LRRDGTLWLNLGDGYAGSWGAQSRGGPPSSASTLKGNGHIGGGPKIKSLSTVQIAAHPHKESHTGTIRTLGLKPKDLIGIPWRVAFALQDDGWWLRRDIIWEKPNPMPESVRDRCTSAHEYLFHFAKSADYYYDADAIKEPASDNSHGGRPIEGGPKQAAIGQQIGGRLGVPSDRNKRSVWTIATAPFRGVHFATFPPALVEPCILAGCPPNGLVLDPFAGAGTVGLVAQRLGRDAVLIELNQEYAAMAEKRIAAETPGFAFEAASS
jgi:hypothetical protein